LVHEPDLIILDEPTAGIDPLLRATVWDELHRLRDAGRTLLVTTQHVGEAEEGDTVAMIGGGLGVPLLPPDQLRRARPHRRTSCAGSQRPATSSKSRPPGSSTSPPSSRRPASARSASSGLAISG